MKKNQKSLFTVAVTLVLIVVFTGLTWVGIRIMDQLKQKEAPPVSSQLSVSPPAPKSEEMAGLCVTVKPFDDQPLSNCKFTFLQMATSPLPTVDSTGDCSGKGQYYFDLPQGTYDVAVDCDTHRGPIEIGTRVSTQHATLVADANPKEGHLYTQNKGYPLDSAQPFVDIVDQFCEGTKYGTCKPLKVKSVELDFASAPSECSELVRVDGTVISADSRRLKQLKEVLYCSAVATVGGRKAELGLMLSPIQVFR